MDIFETGLCVLSLMCALIYKQSTHPGCSDSQFSKFKRTYLFVYLLATGIYTMSVDGLSCMGMTKYRKGPTKEHYTGPQRIGNHEKAARLATVLCNF